MNKLDNILNSLSMINQKLTILDSRISAMEVRRKLIDALLSTKFIVSAIITIIFFIGTIVHHIDKKELDQAKFKNVTIFKEKIIDDLDII